MTEQNWDWEKIQLAKKYLLEELSPEEQQLFERWLKQDADFKETVQRLSSDLTWRGGIKLVGQLDETKAWERFVRAQEPAVAKRSRRHVFSVVFRAAAVFFVVLLGGYSIYHSIATQEVDIIYPSGTYTNEIGKVTAFMLPDSTKVWLSTGSELTYAENFTRNRKVNLKGEAFFEVRRNPEFPFEITTDSLVTSVLGTSFNLRAYQGEAVELAVYSGKVRFGDLDELKDSFVLTKGQTVSWEAGRGFSKIQSFDFERMPDWKRGVFHFENASIDEIVLALSHWYPLAFEVTGKTDKCRYTGEFNRSSLQQVLEIMSYSLNLSYELNEKKVQIKPKPC